MNRTDRIVISMLQSTRKTYKMVKILQLIIYRPVAIIYKLVEIPLIE